MSGRLRTVLASLGAFGLGVALTAVVMSWGAGAHAPDGVARSSATSARAEHAALAALAQMQLTAPDQPAPHTAGVGPAAAHQPNTTNAIKDTGSFNWSGYLDKTTTKNYFTSVSGSWTQEKVTCSAEDRMSSTWVGIDGASDKTVEQTGTLAWCYEDAAYYYSWYEMYPAATVVIGTEVKAGDKISASVTRSGTSYDMVLTDSTTSGNDVSITKTCALATCHDTSVEWINERPTVPTGMAPLVQYRTWSLTGAAAAGGSTSGVITAFPTTYNTQMVDSYDNYPLATAGTLNSSGSGFTTTWDDSY